MPSMVDVPSQGRYGGSSSIIVAHFEILAVLLT
jgi:hypothetical protein